MNKFVYKIAAADSRRAAAASGYFACSADDLRDGYVHLSARHQLRGTLEKHFRAENDLLLIAYESETLGPSLKWETSRGGDQFPHFYGHLPVSQSLWQRPLIPGSDGIPDIDEAWFAC